MKNISILGSTGSIGRQTLEVAAANPEKLKVRALAAHKSDELLEQQIKQFEPDIAVLTDKDAAKRLADRYHGKTEILAGEEGLLAAATYEGADTVLGSMVGYAGLRKPDSCGQRAQRYFPILARWHGKGSQALDYYGERRSLPR